MEDVSLFWEPWVNDTKVFISPNVKFAKYTISGIEATREIAHYEKVGKSTVRLLVHIRQWQHIAVY